MNEKIRKIFSRQTKINHFVAIRDQIDDKDKQNFARK